MTQQEHESNVKNLQELIQENEESMEEKNNLIAEYRSQIENMEEELNKQKELVVGARERERDLGKSDQPAQAGELAEQQQHK